MNQPAILIIGANGQLGIALQQQYPEAHSVDSHQLDITNQAAVQNFDWTDIRVVLNAAAYTNVDGAESAEGRVAAWQVNAVAVANLAAAAREHDLTLVHISSDYVFDGTNQNHPEDEPFSPLGVYGQSKAAGDIAAASAPKHYILRATWVIGEGKNFVRTMLGLAAKNIEPTVVADQVGRPTFTTELVRIIDHLLTIEAAYGTYNATNDGQPASWADITREIFRDAGRGDLTVADTTTAEYYAGKEGIAPRPLKSIMDLSKLQATGFAGRDWHDDLADYVKKETDQA